jgi:hypothetical protein
MLMRVKGQRLLFLRLLSKGLHKGIRSTQIECAQVILYLLQRSLIEAQLFHSLFPFLEIRRRAKATILPCSPTHSCRIST